MLTKETVVDRVEVLEDGHVQVRHATYIAEDGERIAGPIYRREVFEPGDAAVNTAVTKVRDIAAAVWTDSVVRAHEDRKAARAAAEAARGRVEG